MSVVTKYAILSYDCKDTNTTKLFITGIEPESIHILFYIWKQNNKFNEIKCEGNNEPENKQ